MYVIFSEMPWLLLVEHNNCYVIKVSNQSESTYLTIRNALLNSDFN